jgi:propanediol utilization protein
MYPLTSGGTVEISLSQQDGFSNSVTIPSNTSGNIIDRNIYVHVKMNGQTSSPELKIIQQDVIHTDELIYAEIPITDTDLIDIVVNNTKDISDFVTQQTI